MSSKTILTVGPERISLDGGAGIPLARFERVDGKPRTHHPRCPTHPGEPLGPHSVCADCIYGALESPDAA